MCAGVFFHVVFVGTNFEFFFQSFCLPCNPPVRRNPTYVEGETLSGGGLSTGNVGRTVERSGKVEVVVPHRIPTNSRHILPQSSLNNWSGRGRGRYVTGDEWKAPGWRRIPQVFHGWVVI